MKNLILGSAIFLLLNAGASAAVVKVPLAWCNGCTESQKNEKARFAGSLGVVYVSDLSNRTSQAYNVTRSIVGYDEYGNPIYGAKQAVSIATSAEYVNMASTLMDFYNSGQSGWSKSGEIGYQDRTVNVYHVASKGAVQNNFLSNVRANSWVSSAALGTRLNQLSSIFSFANQATVPKISIDVAFSDGSSIGVLGDLSLSSNRYQVIENSGIDKFNNIVLSKPISGGFTFDLTGADAMSLDLWGEHMGAMGYGGASSTAGVWYCSGGGGGPFTCRLL